MVWWYYNTLPHIALQYAGSGERCNGVNGEFFAADVEGVESVGAVGAVFEQIFLALGELFSGFVLAEAVAVAGYPCGLDCQNKIIVILAVEEWHQTLPPGKGLVYEQIFLVVAHRVAEIDGLDRPPVPLKFVHHPPAHILFVDGIVGVERGGVVIVYDGLVAVVLVVFAEVGDKGGYLALEFGIKGFYDVQAAVARLSGYNPVVIRYNILSI